MKYAVFGLGFMGSTHLKALKNIPQAELCAVVSDVPAALAGDLSGVQGNIGGPGEKLDFSNLRKFDNPYDALRDPEIEAVDLCLPTNLHYQVAVEALRAGKHVLVEKPMALTAAQCDEILREAEKSGRILMVAQVLRFVPSYRATAEMVKAGRLGAIRSAILRRRCSAPAWSLWLGQKNLSGGGIFDLLIHDIDFCLQVFGKPEAISAVGYEDMPRGIDWITAQLHYPEIGGVVISGGWHHPKAFPFSMEFTVVGDCGTLEYNSSGLPLTLYRDDGEAEKVAIPDTDGYQAEIQYFMDCCVNNRKPEFCPPQESANAVKVALLMLEARNRNGEKIECRL
jgi:predicted dehydrogenase